MNINFESTIDQEALSKSVLVNEVGELLKGEFIDRDYGGDIENLSIKLSVVNPPEGFEHLHKILLPKYIDSKKVKNKYTGETVLFKKHFFCSINIMSEEYVKFVSSSDKESKRMLTMKILESLKNLEIPKKIKYFDKDSFINDLNVFFKSQDII